MVEHEWLSTDRPATQVAGEGPSVCPVVWPVAGAAAPPAGH